MEGGHLMAKTLKLKSLPQLSRQCVCLCVSSV